MTLSEISEIESSFNIVLPDYYRNVLLNYPPHLMETGGPEFELVSYPEKLIDENKQAYVDLWGKPLNKSYFVVGENGCGDYLIIDLSNDIGVIAFEHETDAFYRLSSSLAEYIELIPDGKYEKNFGKEEFLLNDIRNPD